MPRALAMLVSSLHPRVVAVNGDPLNRNTTPLEVATSSISEEMEGGGPSAFDPVMGLSHPYVCYHGGGTCDLFVERSSLKEMPWTSSRHGEVLLGPLLRLGFFTGGGLFWELQSLA